MRMKRIIIGFCLLFLFPGSALAESLASSSSPPAKRASDTCIESVNRSLNKERFIYESRLFGLRRAADEEPGTTRIDHEGEVWMKSSEGVWRNGGDVSIMDNEMDALTAIDDFENEAIPLKGILETQRATTSDLIPPLLQSFRALNCRVDAVCEAVAMSMQTASGTIVDANGFFTIEVPGCIPLKIKELSSCRFVTNTSAQVGDTFDEATALTYCRPAAQHLLGYEREQLKFLVHYDASHRSLRQFSGYLDPLLDIVHFPLLSPLRQVASFLGQWSRIPCFLSHCAEEEPGSLPTSFNTLPIPKNSAITWSATSAFLGSIFRAP